jgi:glycosyltransferase involved in cell wall biosynthesis
MIKTSITKKVLTLGTDYQRTKGGVAQVLKVYSSFFQQFNYIPTKRDGNSLYKLIIFFIALIKLLWFLLFCKIKIVHIHGSSYNSFWRKRVFIVISKLFGKRVIYHIHGAEFHLFYNKNKKIVKQTLLKCDVILALSDHWLTFFKEEIGHTQVKVVKNVIELPLPQKNNSKEIFQILFLGHLGERKGIFELLEMLGENKKDFSGKLKLNIGGNGNVEKIKKIIKKENIEDIVTFHGWVSGLEKKQLLRDSHIFILPSYNEGVPISILEAMSYGLPIISTPVGGIPDVVKNGKNGILIEPGNKLEMRQALKKLIGDDGLLEKMGMESRKASLNHLPQNIEKTLESVYQELL